MTDAPVRKITGLSPRRDVAPLARLMKAERDRAGTEAPAAVVPLEADPPATPAPLAAEPAAPAARAEPGVASAADIKVPVTLRWATGLRQRSRAAYLATRREENDESYSEMVEKAVETELRRREALYNGSQPYAGGEAQLPAGRPFLA